MQYVGREFTRAELHELVWSKPIRSLAGEFGVSDVALAKACRKANIPVPERGYWTREAAGKATFRSPLPPRFPGAVDCVVVGPRTRVTSGDWKQQILDTAVPPVPVYEEDLGAVEARVRKWVGHVACPQDFEHTNPLIARLLAHDEERRERYARSHFSWDVPKYDDGPERRRLLILNALCLVWRRIGCRPSMSTSKYAVEAPERRGVSVLAGDTWVTFTLEAAKPKRDRHSGQTPSGCLRLSLRSAQNRSTPEVFWEDSVEKKLERCLADIAVAVVVRAEERYRNGRVYTRDRLIEQKAKAERRLAEIQQTMKRRAREVRDRKRQCRIDDLLDQAACLHKAETIRAYVSAIRERSTGPEMSQSSLSIWATWALSVADSIDPSKSGVAESAIRCFAKREAPVA